MKHWDQGFVKGEELFFFYNKKLSLVTKMLFNLIIKVHIFFINFDDGEPIIILWNGTCLDIDLIFLTGIHFLYQTLNYECTLILRAFNDFSWSTLYQHFTASVS